MEPVPRAQWDRWKHQFVYLSPVGPESGPDWWSCIKSACCIRNIWGFPKIRRPDSVWCCSCHIKPVERDGALTQLMEQSLHSAASSLLLETKLVLLFLFPAGQEVKSEDHSGLFHHHVSPCVDVWLLHHQLLFINVRKQKYSPNFCFLMFLL